LQTRAAVFNSETVNHWRGITLNSKGNSEKRWNEERGPWEDLLRLDNKGEEKGEKPREGVEHSESEVPAESRIFFLRRLDKKSSLGVPMDIPIKADPPIILEKKLP